MSKFINKVYKHLTTNNNQHSTSKKLKALKYHNKFQRVVTTTINNSLSLLIKIKLIRFYSHF